jgi:hypothetical protein
LVEKMADKKPLPEPRLYLAMNPPRKMLESTTPAGQSFKIAGKYGKSGFTNW